MVHPSIRSSLVLLCCGGVKYTQALVFLQELSLGLHLVPHRPQLLLLLPRTALYLGHGQYLLPGLLETALQLRKLLVHILVVFIHAGGKEEETA